LDPERWVLGVIIRRRHYLRGQGWKSGAGFTVRIRRVLSSEFAFPLFIFIPSYG
jgi:hypothetical protein